MISVLLTLLKIIGIVLLSLLGIILGLILMILFVPVRYRLKGYYKDEFVLHGKVTWLLHFVSVKIDYDKEPVTSIKILGISIDKFIKNGPKSDRKDVSETDNADTSDINSKNNVPKMTNTNSDTELSVVSTLETKSENSLDKTMELCTDDSQKETPDKKSISDKIKHVYNMIKEKIISIYRKICDILNKIKQLFHNIKSGKETVAHYISILKKDEVKQAFSLCKKRIWKMIKHILPKKMKVNITAGFDDPATTGYILAGYSVLPTSISEKIILHTDFNKQIFECDYNIKGHVNAWSLLYQIICIVLNKNCKSLFQIVKKEILDERK